MLSSFSEKAIMTKVKAMYGRRITDAQYRELLHRRSVAEVAAYLRDETDYRDILLDTAPNAVHREQLENLLRKHRYMQYLKLLRYDSSQSDSYYQFPIVRAEAEQLLHMIQLLNFGRADEYITMYPAYLAHLTSFSLSELARVRSFDELRTLLHGTPYGEVLAPHLPAGTQQANLAHCETALYRYFYARCDELARTHYGKATVRALTDIRGTHMELMNVYLIYRMKKFFPDTTPEEICAMMLKSGRIPDKVMREWANAPDADAFLQALYASPYQRYIDAQDFVFIEYTGECIRYHLNRRYLRFGDTAPVAFTSYMVLSELELKNITTIIEGIRYSVPSDEIQKLLIV